MALIFCWECGEKVSDSAATCPHCGAPLKKSDSGSGPVEYQQRIERVRCWGTSSAAIQEALSKYTVDGWEIVSMAQDHLYGGFASPVFTVAMRRPKGYIKKERAWTPPAVSREKKECCLTIARGGKWASVTGCSQGDFVTIPDAYQGVPVKEIGEDAFRGIGIEEIKIPDSVVSVGKGAFCGCSKLLRVDMGKGVREIRESAFERTGIERAVIPDSVTLIGKHAFYRCDRLFSVVMGKGVREIGADVFSNSSFVRKIYYLGDEKSWAAVKKKNPNTALHLSEVVFYSKMQ